MKGKKRKRGLIRKYILLGKIYIRKIFSMRSDVHQIALGFAVGTFIGIFPTFGIGLILLSFLSLFIRFNVPSAVIGNTLMGNPLTTPFWVLISYQIGKVLVSLLGLEEISFIKNQTLKKIFSMGFDYLLGNLLISIIMTFLSYHVIYYLVRKYKSKKDMH